MHFKSVCALSVAGLIGAFAMMSAPSAGAAQTKRVAHHSVRHVAAARPPAARITVRRRSYLDAGSPAPGEGTEHDYAFPPGYSATSVIDGTSRGHRLPLPGPFDLPSRQNPYPWNWCVGC